MCAFTISRARPDSRLHGSISFGKKVARTDRRKRYSPPAMDLHLGCVISASNGMAVSTHSPFSMGREQQVTSVRMGAALSLPTQIRS